MNTTELTGVDLPQKRSAPGTSRGGYSRELNENVMKFSTIADAAGGEILHLSRSRGPISNTALDPVAGAGWLIDLGGLRDV